MGVPALFSNVVKKHPSVIKTLDGTTVCNTKKHILTNKSKVTPLPQKNTCGYDNLYLDSNSIVYDCVHRLSSNINHNTAITDETIINNVCKQIHTYINTVKPRETVIIAFDGVAPVAKLENQRNRRYKSEFTSSLLAHAGVVKTAWDTTAITPGTPFMEKLDAGLNAYFAFSTEAATKRKFGAKQVIVSSSVQHGEGEHKIFEFIRNNAEKHKTLQERTVIYGLDADLIMLSINHLVCCPNLFLFRETPHFIRSLNRNLDPGQLYTLDIKELFEGVCETMYGGRHNERQTQTKQYLPYDYVFLVSMLGNDYIPHNPAFNIRTGGLDILMDTYRECFITNQQSHKRDDTDTNITYGNVMTDGNTIHWDKFYIFVKRLVDMEEGLLVKEHKNRNAMESRTFYLRDDNGRDTHNESIIDENKKLEDEIIQRLNVIPIYNREKEKYIEPTEPYWQERYYVALFGGKRGAASHDVCMTYLEALEWTMLYYTTGCPDWRWSYPYAYAPLFEDLVEYIPKCYSISNTSSKTSVNTTNSIITNKASELSDKPVSPLTQLAYVLPVSAQHMLPDKIRNEIKNRMEDKYGKNWGFEWSFCRYFWECHAKMPHIDVDYLERITSSVVNKI